MYDSVTTIRKTTKLELGFAIFSMALAFLNACPLACHAQSPNTGTGANTNISTVANANTAFDATQTQFEFSSIASSIAAGEIGTNVTGNLASEFSPDGSVDAWTPPTTQAPTSRQFSPFQQTPATSAAPLAPHSDAQNQWNPTQQPPQYLTNVPWWAETVPTALRSESSAIPIQLDLLFALTANHSGRVLAIAQQPWVSQMQLEQARAVFDPTHYSDSRFDSTSDPVENTLVTGGPPRQEDDVLSIDTGFRGQNQRGGNYRIGQEIGHKNSNSNFFVPNDQGSARLVANLTQPLWRGRNIDPNRSLILTAQFDTEVAKAEFQETLQKQLVQVADTYWSLYLERASLIQRRRHLTRAMKIADLLQSRADHDAAYSQVLRAKAAVANRIAELAQADARIRNFESRLRALINAPQLVADRNSEFLTIQPALLQPWKFDIEQQVKQALNNRPELLEIASKMQALQVRLGLAQDQTRPLLNMVAEGYLAGRKGNSDIPGAFADQFSEGRPGVAFGLVYERPVGNRAATAAVRQRQFEINQLNFLMAEATENIRAEVESAVRNIDATMQAANSRQVALQAVVSEVDALFDRWETLGNDPRLGQLQLNDLLAAQDRLLQEEQNLLQVLVQYNRDLMELQRATGALVKFAH